MIKFYEGPYQQRGAGFGGLFKGLFSMLKPLGEAIKPVLQSPLTKKIASEVLTSGANIASDVIAGRKFKESAQDNLKKAKKRVAATVYDTLKSHAYDSEEEESEEEPPRPSFKKKKYAKLNAHKRTILD